MGKAFEKSSPAWLGDYLVGILANELAELAQNF
jgi:hypothetical protein